jgi:hypothetical protein
MADTWREPMRRQRRRPGLCCHCNAFGLPPQPLHGGLSVRIPRYRDRPVTAIMPRFFRACEATRPKEKSPEGCEAWRSQSTSTDCRAWKKVSRTRRTRKERRRAALFLLLWARTPLTIVAHIFSGRRVVICPTLGAIGRIGARYPVADACLNSADRAAAGDAAEPRGEGRGC